MWFILISWGHFPNSMFFSQWAHWFSPSQKSSNLWRLHDIELFTSHMETYKSQYGFQEDNIETKWGVIWNMLANTLGIGGTCCKPIWNLMRTYWEQQKPNPLNHFPTSFNRFFFENGVYLMHAAIPSGLSRILFPTLFICAVFWWNYLFSMTN
jgi:hypothetical protein